MLTMRPATMDDAGLLLAWRNDPVTRASCRCSEPVDWAEHAAWLERVLADPTREISIHELNGVPVGTTRLDWSDGEAEFSITVAPKYRGRGVVRSVMAKGLPACRTVAFIMFDNDQSQRLARLFDFLLVKDGPLQRWVKSALQSAAA